MKCSYFIRYRFYHLFHFFAGKSEPFTLVINNQSPYTIDGKISFLDVGTETSPLMSEQKLTKTIDLQEIQKYSKLKNQIGKVPFYYKIGNKKKEIDIFGYVESGDHFLNGKQASLIFDPPGQPKVTFDFEQD